MDKRRREKESSACFQGGFYKVVKSDDDTVMGVGSIIIEEEKVELDSLIRSSIRFTFTIPRTC